MNNCNHSMTCEWRFRSNSTDCWDSSSQPMRLQRRIRPLHAFYFLVLIKKKQIFFIICCELGGCSSEAVLDPDRNGLDATMHKVGGPHLHILASFLRVVLPFFLKGYQLESNKVLSVKVFKISLVTLGYDMNTRCFFLIIRIAI